MQWPARSPGLSPIEHLWDHLGHQVRDRHDFNNIRDLERVLQAELVRIPLQVIRKLICSMRRRCLAVLAANDGHTRIEPCPNFYAGPPSSFHIHWRLNATKLWNNIDASHWWQNQISEDVFDFMISYLPFPHKSTRSELAKLFSISIY